MPFRVALASAEPWSRLGVTFYFFRSIYLYFSRGKLLHTEPTRSLTMDQGSPKYVSSVPHLFSFYHFMNSASLFQRLYLNKVQEKTRFSGIVISEEHDYVVVWGLRSGRLPLMNDYRTDESGNRYYKPNPPVVF